MTDVSVPLVSRRRERAAVVQQLQHVVVAMVVLVEGVARASRSTETPEQALGVAEVVAAFLVLVSFVRARRAARPHDHAAPPASHRIDWVDLAIAALLSVDVWAHHYETGSWSRPTIAMAATTLVLAVAHGPFVAWAARWRGIHLTNRRIRIGGKPFRRFTARWVDIASIEIGERWAVITAHDGRSSRIDLSDLRNEARVREVLREAEILRTARKRFGPKEVAGRHGLHHISPDASLLDVPIRAASPVAADPVVSPATSASAATPTLIERATVIQAAGNLPKRIEEYAGRVNSGHRAVSVARMVSPEGWLEPGQRPEFEEITVVLRGTLRVEYADGHVDVRAGQAVVAHPGQWIRYSSPEPGGAEYIAVCLPAFAPDTVHRDATPSSAGDISSSETIRLPNTPV